MRNLLLFSILVLIGLQSCKRNPYQVKVSEEINLEVRHFEHDLFNLGPENIQEQIPELQKKYPDFLHLFGLIINIGEPSDPGFPQYLKAFLTDRINFEVYQKTSEVFGDFSEQELNLSRAFNHYHHYFPDKPIPGIITFVSRFNTSLIIDSTLIGLGLDRYLGTDYEYYGSMGLPFYQRYKMDPGKLVSDCMYAWGSTEFNFKNNPDSEVVNNVLNNILYQGKLMYFVNSMMPESSEEEILGFTPEQYKWCIHNEANMWTHLIENDLLFNTDHMTIRKLTGEAPYTGFFPRESPGRAAVWVGLQVVKSYMQKNQQVSLKELMTMDNYQGLLNESGYNPK